MQQHQSNPIIIKGKLISSSEHPLIMGILNVTPDSFFDGGQYNDQLSITNRAQQLISQGADIIDIGAYSSRPGATDISKEEEWSRLSFALNIVRNLFPNAIISVDTFRSYVAERAVGEYDVDIINDISAGQIDSQMFPTVAKLHVPYILMHMQGTPATMQLNPHYASVTNEVISNLSFHLEQLYNLGVSDVIIDPGFGFGKSIDNNYQLMAELERFKIFNLPILVGISRKSMIYKLFGTSPNDSLNGTTALNIVALQKGANILRVHDVKECLETIRIFEMLEKAF